MSTEAPARLLSLDARCPICQSRPAIRITQLEARLKAKLPPHLPVLTVQCFHCSKARGQTVIYGVTAEAFQRAS